MVFGPNNQSSTVRGQTRSAKPSHQRQHDAHCRSAPPHTRAAPTQQTFLPPTHGKPPQTKKDTYPQLTHCQLNPSRRNGKVLPISNFKPINLKGDDQGDHVKSRTGMTHRGNETNYPGDGEKIWADSNKGEDKYPLSEDNTDAWRTKGADGTTSKGEEHR